MPEDSGQPTATLRMRMWLEDDGDQVLGLGRMVLLRQVAEQGSLNKAAKALGMSYRAAWGRMKRCQEKIGRPLVEKQGPHGGFVLTSFGREVLEALEAWYQEVEDFAAEAAARRLPFNVQTFHEGDS
ncbi:winged helix-turn-helix domain-containing protein [Desulfohalovibrio reitneri]|uniref:winged helix-turn-helix domain-containing protein n=1 Tax=Desulfohalovibrio reitneri TaxID=1307759 RepID=UPI000552254A|nr:LysR family transcriptional regulator [Desulfohalovibrio reitneri]